MRQDICIEITRSGVCRRIEHPVWVTRNRNGVHATPHRVKAKGVCDGETIWSFGELEGYPEARIITLAEYEQTLGAAETDPELTAEEALNIIMGGSYETE